jgi:hypothetical protein
VNNATPASRLLFGEGAAPPVPPCPRQRESGARRHLRRLRRRAAGRRPSGRPGPRLVPPPRQDRPRLGGPQNPAPPPDLGQSLSSARTLPAPASRLAPRTPSRLSRCKTSAAPTQCGLPLPAPVF